MYIKIIQLSVIKITFYHTDFTYCCAEAQNILAEFEFAFSTMYILLT